MNNSKKGWSFRKVGAHTARRLFLPQKLGRGSDKSQDQQRSLHGRELRSQGFGCLSNAAIYAHTDKAHYHELC